MQDSLSNLVDNTCKIFKSEECKSCIEKLKINSDCYYAELKNDRLIYKCKKCKNECKKPINELKKKFRSIYQFCDGKLNKFVLLLRKGVYRYEYMDSWKKFNEIELPPKKDFYCNFNLENISDKEKSMGCI